jgi:GNAT superfamily N-acetyltransferase
MIKIRTGSKEDIPQVLELVRELAAYENALNQVENTVERMIEDGFGDQPVYGLFVAEKEEKIVGISIYYFRYSTWKGKRIYLEDIVVTEPLRGKGIGSLLFDATIKKGKETNCTGMMWQVLDWNEPAIKFYEQKGAQIETNWNNCHLHF